MLEILHAKVTSNCYYSSLWNIAKNVPAIGSILRIGSEDVSENRGVKHIRNIVAAYVRHDPWSQSILESVVGVYKEEPGMIEYYPALRAIDPAGMEESLQMTCNRISFEIENTSVRVSSLEHGIIKQLFEDNDHQIIVLRVNINDDTDNMDSKDEVEEMWIKYVLGLYEKNRIVCNNIIFLISVNDTYYTYTKFLGSYTISATELFVKLRNLWAARQVKASVSQPIPIPVPFAALRKSFQVVDSVNA